MSYGYVGNVTTNVMKNLVSTFTYHSFEISNRFDPLSTINSSAFSISSPSVDHFHPPSHSSPRATPQHGQHVQHAQRNRHNSTPQVQSISDCSLSSKDYGLPTNTNLRTLVVNCNRIQGKCAERYTTSSRSYGL